MKATLGHDSDQLISRGLPTQKVEVLFIYIGYISPILKKYYYLKQ